MTIEIRELIVRAQVGPPQGAVAPPALSAAQLERLRRELLGEVKALLREQQQRRQER